MISIVDTQAKGTLSQIVLVNDQNKPTPALIGLAVCEVALDCLIAYAAFKALKALKG